MGSGFFVTPDGLLVTNAHVIEESTKLYVYVQDRIVIADPRVLAIDPDRDLAALQVRGHDFLTLSLAHEPPPEGTEAVAVGYPRITDILQMGFALHATVGSGTIGGVAQGRSRRAGRPAWFIQTTGILNFGNSGGPLMNVETGEAVGMVVTTVPYAERARDRNGSSIGSVSLKSGIGYSIPAPVIREWLASHQLSTGAERPSIRPVEPPTGEPDALRSFATGHVLQIVAGVLQQDADLLNLAIAHYETAASLRPAAPWITRNLGRAYAAAGRWSEAVDAYQKAVAVMPTDADLFTDLGLAWQRTGRHDRAVEAYRTALQLNPRSGRVHNNYGQLLWELGQLDEALIEFRYAVGNEPQSSLATYNLGLALEANGRRQEAMDAWEAFLRAGHASADSEEWTTKIKDGLARLRPTASAYPTAASAAH
jgi:Tfp pilus assembly protein PilF